MTHAISGGMSCRRGCASLDGAYGVLADARDSGLVRMIGMTSHQREMAARIAAGKLLPESEPADGIDPSRPLDALILRYNAAHQHGHLTPRPQPKNPATQTGCRRLRTRLTVARNSPIP
jgi:hypothetical protein